jgi:hypothetical protein
MYCSCYSTTGVLQAALAIHCLWLNRSERYFHVRHTPEHKRVAFIAFYLLDDAQLWFHHLELSRGHPTWP